MIQNVDVWGGGKKNQTSSANVSQNTMSLGKKDMQNEKKKTNFSFAQVKGGLWESRLRTKRTKTE